ncbi:MAG: 2'-5' RNA ligase family protein [Candidatus Competibacteraceae bacterium]|nr:2'-5' RNA ligase family protein [Candidatus Competibacteraceae bacterium]
MFQYANDTSGWKDDWQFEYRFGAFYIFPPTGVIEPVDALRQTYDPRSASGCQAHISLSESLPAPLSDEQLEQIHTALSAVQPFDIRYGPLRSFPPYPGVCYSITPEDNFRTLRSTLHSTSAFAGVALKHEHIAPHMTIAEFELSGKVPEGTFRCDSIEYAIPNDKFYFERVLTIPLKG